MYFQAIYLFKKKKDEQFSKVEKTKIAVNTYIEYSTCKNIVLTYAQRADKTGIKNADIKAGFWDSLMDVNNIEKCLEKIASPFMDPVNRIYKFRLNDDSLKMYDPFSYFMKEIINKNNDLSLFIMHKVKDPTKYDHFFGEFANPSQITCISPTGLPLIPFKQIFREFLSQTDLINLAKIIVESEDQSFVSPWMLRCAYKLIISSIPFNKSSEKRINELLVKNMHRFSYDESFKEIIENYKKMFYSGNVSSEEEKESPENLELARKNSVELKAKMEKIKNEVRQEFEKKVQAFKNKNKTILSETVYVDISKVCFVCGCCREAVNVSTYEAQPYGKIIYIHKSKMYGHHLQQVINKSKHKAWQMDSQLPSIPGLTHGLTITSCGHYLHEKCYRHILEKRPNNAVSEIDAKYHQETYLCPLCKVCGNAILTPYDVILSGSQKGIKQIQDTLLSELRISYDDLFEAKSNNYNRFSLICDCISYQFHLIDLTSVADFNVKEDFIHSLVSCLRALAQPNLYTEMMTIKEVIDQTIGFLFKDYHQLFSKDLVSVFTQLIVAAKIMDPKGQEEVIYSELIDKVYEIIKLAIIQIILKRTCTRIKGVVTFEALDKGLEENSIKDIMSKKGNLEKDLIPFLKKLLCLKLVLFPTPGRDAKADLAKVGWLLETHGIDFYLVALDLKQDIYAPLLAENLVVEKEAFLRIPFINREWMRACFTSLLKTLKKDGQDVKDWPILATFSAGFKKFELINLETDFAVMRDNYVDKRCKFCQQLVRDNAICLLCGEILCAASKCCKREGIGELSYHSFTCPSRSGIYLRLLYNKVILIDGGHICTYPSPYVNKYGESVDVSKSRDSEGLKLENRIVEELKNLYLGHSLPQTTRLISLRSFVRFTSYAL